jgi:hypothetical protein
VINSAIRYGHIYSSLARLHVRPGHESGRLRQSRACLWHHGYAGKLVKRSVKAVNNWRQVFAPMIGRRTGVARILGINFSGFVAW